MSIETPRLIINYSVVLENICRMKAKADRNGLVFRPHFKTHRNLDIAEMFRAEGINCITVSSLSMAEKFSNAGWKDITIAFPFNILEIETLKRISGKSFINIVVESDYTIEFLKKKIENKIGIFIKIDSGYHRTGIDPDNYGRCDSIISTCNKTNNAEFLGFLMHAGHSYKAKGKEEILSIHSESEKIAGKLKSRFPKAIISIGDTPSCSLAESFENIDEIRPGNFVYYDIMQYYLGTCNFNNIAVLVACPVVSLHPQRNEIVIYGGAVHLSKEQIQVKNKPFFGAVCILDENQKWINPIEEAYVSSLSQEHGIIKMPAELFREIKIGDLLGIVPVHSCLVSDLV